MPASERTPEQTFPSPPEWPEVFKEDDPGLDARTCPGYLVALPQVLQAARLVSWYRTGQLSVRLDGVPATPILCDAIDILESEQSAADCYSLEHPDEDRR